MKVTRLGPGKPLLSLSGLLSGGPSGQVPTANGSNSVAFGSNVAIITANGSNALVGPYVNFASGSNIIFAVASNTLTIHGQAGGASGVPSVSHSSNTYTGAIILLPGTNMAITSPVAGTFEFHSAGAQGPAGPSGGGGGTFPLGVAAPDKIPASPGAEDEEFEGTADTLPTADYAWVAEPVDWSLNSDYPSWFVWERADNVNTEYKLRISNFTMDATSGLWVKMGTGHHNSDVCQFEWIIYDSASSNGYGAGVHNGNVWLARDSNAGTLANRGTVTLTTFKGNHMYIGVKRVANTWETFVSSDGINWQEIQSPDTRSFTVARLEFRWSSNAAGTGPARASIDWIRYRTDNLFPRP